MPNKKIPSLLESLEDCDRPSCGDIQQMFREQQQKQVASPSSSTVAKKTSVTVSSSADCPADSATLGRSSWTLLHSMAAWYPDIPTKEDQEMMHYFMQAVARFYPCTYCAHDFQANLQQTPVVTNTRENLCLWLCDQHNRVNQKLGKEAFPCTMQQLDNRWRKSNDPKCQGSSK